MDNMWGDRAEIRCFVYCGHVVATSSQPGIGRFSRNIVPVNIIQLLQLVRPPNKEYCKGITK